MKEDKDKKTEDWLRSFSLRPAPPVLKEKILHSVSHKKRSSSVITPWFGKGFLATLILLIVVIAVDAAVSSTQIKRLSSLLGIHQEPTFAQEEEWSLLKEIIWDPLDASGNTAKQKLYERREKSETNKRQPGWRKILEEEFDYDENTKNLP